MVLELLQAVGKTELQKTRIATSSNNLCCLFWKSVFEFYPAFSARWHVWSWSRKWSLLLSECAFARWHWWPKWVEELSLGIAVYPVLCTYFSRRAITALYSLWRLQTSLPTSNQSSGRLLSAHMHSAAGMRIEHQVIEILCGPCIVWPILLWFFMVGLDGVRQWWWAGWDDMPS